MRALATALLIAACAPAYATDYQLVAHGVSYHIKKQDDGKPYEWLNVGVGVRAEFSPAWGAQVGFYRNSFDRLSAYAVGEGLAEVTQGLRVGLCAGIVTGYPYGHGYPVPVAALVGRYTLTDRLEAAVRILPPVHPKVVGTVAVELAWRL